MKINIQKKLSSMTDGSSTPFFLKGENGYEASLGAYRAVVAKPETGAAVTLTGDGINVGWRWLGEKKPERLTICGSSAIYEGILPDVDLEYRVSNSGIKENVILKKSVECDRFAFSLFTGGLSVHEDADGSLSLCDGDTVRLTIPAPFMFDAKGAHSDAVRYDLVPEGDGYRLTLCPDPAWLSDPARVFPITVDPQMVVPLNLYGFCRTSVQKKGHNQSQWEDIESPTELSVSNNGTVLKRTLLTFYKDFAPIPYHKTKSVKVFLTPVEREHTTDGFIDVNGTSRYYNVEQGAIEIDITDLMCNTEELIFSIPIEPTVYVEGQSPHVDFAFHLTGELAPFLLVESVAGEYDEPAWKELPSVPKTAGQVNLSSGEVAVTFPIVENDGSPYGYSIFQSYKYKNGSNHFGKHMRLNLDETLVKNKDDDLAAEYVYTDEAGDEFGFKVRFYYIEDGKRNYLSHGKAATVKKVNGVLKDEDGHTVIKEHCSSTNWTLSFAENVQEIEEARAKIEELKEQKTSYYNTLRDYVKIHMGTGDIVHRFKAFEMSQEGCDKFLSTVSGALMILPGTEAASYKGILLQKTDFDGKEYANQIMEMEKLKPLAEREKANYQEMLRMNPDGYANPSTGQFFSREELNQRIEEAGARVASYTEQIANLNQTIETASAVYANYTEQANIITGRLSLYIESFTKMMDAYLTCERQIEELTEYLASLPTCYLRKENVIKAFNEKGELVFISDTCGNALFITRDENKRIVNVSDDKEKTVLFTYTDTGMLKSVTDTFGRKTEMSYEDEYLKEICYFDGSEVALSYANDRLEGLAYAENGQEDQSLTLSYLGCRLHKAELSSSLAEISHAKHRQGERQSLAYRELKFLNDLVFLTDEDGNREIFRFAYNVYKDVNEIVERYTEVGGLVTAAERYSYTHYSALTDAVERVEYAEKNSLRKESFKDFTFVCEDTLTTTLNQLALPKSRESNEKYVWRDEDALHFYTKKEKTDYAYDELFLHPVKITETAIYDNGFSDHTEHCTVREIRYNSSGLPIYQETYISGSEDMLGKTVEEFVYDERGNEIEKYVYNTLDSASKFCTARTYGERDEVLSEADATGRFKTEYTYFKGTDRRRTQKLPNGSELSYGYDASDNITSVTQSTEEGEENSTRTLTTLGLVTEVNSANHKVNYTYDTKRRVSSVLVDGTAYVSYNYGDVLDESQKKKGERVTATFANGVSVETETDLFGNTKGVKVRNAPDQPMETCFSSAEYDAQNRPLSFTDEKRGETTTYSYDSITDFLTERTRKKNNAHVLSEKMTHNSYGKLFEDILTFGENDNDRISYTYSYHDPACHRLDFVAMQRLKSVPKFDQNERNAGKTVYSTDGDENRILEESISYLKYGDHATMLPEKVTHRYAGFMGLRHTNSRRYAYDAMGNITHVYEDSELVARYTYDSLNRLVREDAVGFGTRIYTYDACGNILSRRELGLTMEDTEKISPLAGETVYYEYEGDRMVSYNGEPCVYDAIGNPRIYRSYGVEDNVTWTDGRRMASYKKGNNTTTFAYDGFGRRMSKNDIAYTYDFDGRLLRQSDNVNTLTYLYDHTGLAAVEHNGTKYVYVKDVQGNIVALLDTNGTPVVKYVYDAWGKCVVDASTTNTELANLNPFRYRSYYLDNEIGLYFLKTRYYDPEVGRFINADDIEVCIAAQGGQINGINLYAYCLNNPVMHVDATGYSILLTCIIIGLAAGAVIGGTVGGVSAYESASSSGASGWELFGHTLLGVFCGAVIGGAIGATVGGMIGLALPGAIGGGGALALAGGGAVPAVATMTVGEALLAGVTLGLIGSAGVLLARTSKSGGYYGERWPGDPHKPDHVHLRGNNTDIRIGRDGNPLPGEDSLNSQARKALKRLWSEFLDLFSKW